MVTPAWVAQTTRGMARLVVDAIVARLAAGAVAARWVAGPVVSLGTVTDRLASQRAAATPRPTWARGNCALAMG